MDNTPIRKFGWKRDLPDHRDHKLKLPPNRNLVNSDLRNDWMPPIYDQGTTSSCTANAISAAVHYDRRAQTRKEFIPSRLFIYYNEREMEGTIESDAGAMIRDGIKSVSKLGAPDEKLWPFDPKNIFTRPSQEAYDAAHGNLVTSYALVHQTVDSISSVLSHRVPVVFGTMLFHVFETPTVGKTGIVPMPGNWDAPIGGHAMLIVGVNHEEQHFIVRNSWGPEWGDKGYCYFPFDYILNPELSADFWCIWSVT